MSETMTQRQARKAALKDLIRKLHQGADPQRVKGEFAQVIADVSPSEIAKIEQELIEEGMPRDEIQRLCEVHLAVFKESLETDLPSAPAGHPIHILSEEHRLLLEFASHLTSYARQLNDEPDAAGEVAQQLKRFVQPFKDSQSHYEREENVLFPYLEKHGVTEPPAIMWTEHDKIRQIEKDLYRLTGMDADVLLTDHIQELVEVALALAEMLSSHFRKENNILFPTSLKVMGADEWRDVKQQFDELGYCSFTPEHLRAVQVEAPQPSPQRDVEDMVRFAAGALSGEEIEGILDALPVDITFVDGDDRVRYFNRSEERIFPRTRAVIGRTVQQCHPQKSVHRVNQILDDFKEGKRDFAEFWIDLDGRLIYIRYFAVRNPEAEYLGCLEVTQDITDIKQIEGEKRLL